MSFDLWVWREDGPVTAEAAGEKYDALDEQEPEGEPDERVTAFYKELTDRYPELYVLTDDDVDSSPWSDDPGISAAGVFLCIVWSRAEEMLSSVIALAARHGLVCFDLGADVVYNPPGMTDLAGG